jgi:hypothetical protein
VTRKTFAVCVNAVPFSILVRASCAWEVLATGVVVEGAAEIVTKTTSGATEKKTVWVGSGVSFSSTADGLCVLTIVTKVVFVGLSVLLMLFFVVGTVRLIGLVERDGELARVAVTDTVEDATTSTSIG